MIAALDGKKIRKVVKRTCVERRRIRLLKDVMIRNIFKEQVIELVDVGSPN